MNKIVRWSFGFLFLMLIAGVAAAGKKDSFKPARPYVDGELVVEFKDGPASPAALAANKKMGGTVVKVLEKLNLALIQLKPNADTIKAVEKYRKLPGVVTAEPNYIVTPLKRPKQKK